MYQLKQEPEDFVVREVANHSFSSGGYSVCKIIKRNYTTIRALEQISKALGIRLKDIGFAGTKDKRAVTEQHISIKNVNKEKIAQTKLKDITIEFLGYMDKPISLGDLDGNEFDITIRDLRKKEVEILVAKAGKKLLVPNFFGEQRITPSNIVIGKAIVLQDLKKAVDLILKSNPDYKSSMEEHLDKRPCDFVGALKLIPLRLLCMYGRAYQSYLWNLTLEKLMKKGVEDIPMIGFDTDVCDKATMKVIERLMESEKVNFRTFINRKIPELTLEGGIRKAFVEVRDFKILEKGKDFVKVKFFLPKGSYATEAIKFLV